MAGVVAHVGTVHAPDLGNMPPVHPAIVHVPVALVPLSVLAEILARVTGSATLATAGWYALVVAAFGAALAVVAGLFDMSREQLGEEVHHRVHTHMKVGLIVFAAIAALTFWRTLLGLSESAPGWGYVVSATIIVAITIFQAWLGGELVFRHGAGVLPTGQAPASMKGARDSEHDSQAPKAKAAKHETTHAH